jgi:membrane protease YdiL (CAAX protease family)
VFTGPAVLFSPIGEEIFFRGVLQRTLEGPLSGPLATRLECGAFAIVHLCHHGLHWEGAALALWLPSGLIWVALMYAAAQLFAHWRKQAGSVFPAIVSHMAFNAAMGVYIFAGY